MSHWAKVEERGIVWGMHFLLKVYLIFGRQVLQFFLYPVVSYYWLVNRPGRKASQQYLQRISAFYPALQLTGSLKESYLHFISFANALIDKVAAWSGRLSLDDVEYNGREAIVQYMEQGQGVLILGSHLGNLEICRVIAKLRRRVTINVLVHTRHTEKFNSVLNKYADSGTVNLIQVTEVNAATAMLLQDKIEAGELIIIAADRTPVGGQGRVASVEFLGHTANFPQGPFILAMILKCPVFTLFCIKQKGRQVIYFDPFSDGQPVPRQQRTAAIQQAVEKFAKRLERYCKQVPLQWFNFYDFWRTEND
jgi:predicted LPLAT superfamily acyltransferase